MAPLRAHDPRWHRLSAIDGAFLAIESARAPMHIGATAVFEPGTFVDEHGRIDRERYLGHAELALSLLPKWRKRVVRVPLLRHPVLADDPGFDLVRHVRFVHVESGTLQDVDRIAGDAYSRMLDRAHPLWEIVVVDGLEGRRFATIIKLHHCMADGVAGLGSLFAMLRTEPDPARPPPVAPPRPPPPTGLELLRAEVHRRVAEPRALVERARGALRGPRSLRSATRAIVGGVSAAARASTRPAPATPLNPWRVGARRIYRGVQLDLDEVKQVRRRANVKLNDVVLATVASALGRYFESLDEPLTAPELSCMVPVSLHQTGESNLFGNEVSLMIVRLPVTRMPARERLEHVAERSRSAKAAGQSGAFALGETLAEWTFAPLIPWAVRLVTVLRPFNIIVTNIPGPPLPYYLGDAKLVGIFPLVPLYVNQALAIALVSYDRSLYFGLNADPDHFADLDRLAELIPRAFGELRDAHRVPESAAESQTFR